ECQVRMSRRNHLVVHPFFFCPNVAVKAVVCADCDISQVPHPELAFFLAAFCLPAFYRMRPQPARCWSVAVFAAHAVADVECLGPIFRLHRQRMTGLTFCVLFWRSLQAENFSHAYRYVI